MHPIQPSKTIKKETRLLHEKVYLQLRNWIERLQKENKKTPEECAKLLTDLESYYQIGQNNIAKWE